jgi:hypothetical protein
MGHAKQITPEPTKPGTIANINGDDHIFNGLDWQPLRGRDLLHSLQTYGGRFIWPLDPHADEIDAASVAHGLACEFRYGNQSPYPLPVAWHSVALSHVVPRKYAQAALIHDAAEAYLKDVPRPIRRQEPFKTMYGDIEEKLLEVCFEHFGVDFALMDEEFLFYDIKMSWCEMTVWARTSPVFEAKLNVLHESSPERIEDSLDENYIDWVERCPRQAVWQSAEAAWLERYYELF